MASTTSSENALLSSPRSQRMLMWISGIVLLIGIAVFLGAFFLRGNSQDVHSGAPSSRPDRQALSNPLTGSVDLKKVPESTAARNVARTFLLTAVARKQMDVAYRIVGPWLKGGESRAQWLSGNNPVTFFPASNLKTAPMKVLSSTKDALLLEVGPLVPVKMQKGKAIAPLSFKLEVDRLNGRWLVNYFMPEYAMQHLAGDGAGIGGN